MTGNDSAPRPSGARRKPVERQHSAGGLVLRNGHVLLIATAGGRRWQLPKGHVEPGESNAQAAVREVREETGVSGRIVAELPGIDYFFVEKDGRRVRKHVDYFLLDYTGGDEAEYDPAEVDGARWFPWDEALERLSHANERRVAERARELATAAPPQGGER
ncbi:MAG: NUDIX hydrolase [Thermoanaerobaculia bacterium]|nr:MAG: NUDIX hydrolase [Thermoanaerobaculia bacterium]